MIEGWMIFRFLFDCNIGIDIVILLLINKYLYKSYILIYYYWYKSYI